MKDRDKFWIVSLLFALCIFIPARAEGDDSPAEAEKVKQSVLSRYERILNSTAGMKAAPPREGSPGTAAAVKITPLIDRPDTFQSWWENNSQTVYTALIVFFLLILIRNIIKSRTEQKPSRRY